MPFTLTVHLPGQTLYIDAQAGEFIHHALLRAGVMLDAPCGGRQRCGKCLVKAAGALSLPDAAETTLLCGMTEKRLSCHAVILGDCEVWIDNASGARIITENNAEGFSFTPRFTPEDGKPAYGLAVDIGTTSVVCYLYDMESGLRMGTECEMNAQRAYGADVISRVSVCIEREDGTAVLRDTIRGQINGMIRRMCDRLSIDRRDIRRAAVAGNTIMQHIFAGLSPAGMAAAPFTPESLFGAEIPAAKLALDVSENAYIYLPPAVAGYVGGDITAGILASGMDKSEKLCMLVDIGTNGEMALGSRDGLLCCAVAAGPAFEGADITCGMAAADGAISKVDLTGGVVTIDVIGGSTPRGICGSGLVDALAVMRELGAVDETGRLLPPDEAPENALANISETDGGVVFYLDRDSGVYITERDVRKLQLAKAAVAGGIYTLLSHAGKAAEDIDTLYIAGGFGCFIRRESAARIGLLPEGLCERVCSIGNGAGTGASMALLDAVAERRLGEIGKMCEYIELSGDAVFMDNYVEQMMF